MPVTIDTGKAVRRTLRFNSPAEVVRDAEALAAADRSGTLTRTGNWSLGTALGHLAAFIDYGFEEYPPQLNPSWIIKTIIKLQRKKFFVGPMPAGVKIPRIKDGTVGIEQFTTEEGLARFSRSWARLAAASPAKPHPIFGPLSHAEWTAMHFRHAELHLSFFNSGR